MNLIKYLYRLSRLIIKKTMTFLLSILYIGWPKDKSLILFSQANSRYSGNSRELFEFLCKKKLNVIWLYTDEYQRNSAGSEFHNNFIKRNSLQGFILTLKAKKIVISYAGSDFGWYWLYLKSSIVISLWHAIMIKHVALLDNKFTSRMISEYLKNETYYYTYQMVSSDVDRYLTSSSHGIDVRKVLPLGNPKTDKYIRLSKLHQVEKPVRILNPSLFCNRSGIIQIYLNNATAKDLALTLLVFWIAFTNYANNTSTFNNFTVTTNLFYGCTYFHFILRYLMTWSNDRSP